MTCLLEMAWIGLVKSVNYTPASDELKRSKAKTNHSNTTC